MQKSHNFTKVNSSTSESNCQHYWLLMFNFPKCDFHARGFWFSGLIFGPSRDPSSLIWHMGDFRGDCAGKFRRKTLSRPVPLAFRVFQRLVLKHRTPECQNAGTSERRNAGTPERGNTKTRNTKLLKPGTHEKKKKKKINKWINQLKP